jgi:hypothetical protein
MAARAKKPAFFLAYVRDSLSVLFLFVSFDTIICFFQPEDFRHQAGRADAAFFLERAGRRFPRDAEEQALIGPHAFIIRRARFADALSPVFFYNLLSVFRHDIPPSGFNRIDP